MPRVANLSEIDSLVIVFLVGRVPHCEKLASFFECMVEELFSTNLDLPLGASFNLSIIWNMVEQRYLKKLASWKRQYLSKGERLALIRSILFTLPIYFVSVFVILRKVCIRLEIILRGFLYGRRSCEKRLHLVKCPIMCMEKRWAGYYRLIYP